jgi:hypothetical protein
MTYGLSSDAKQIINALKSERDRLKGQVKERTEERDRARRIAVELEQEQAEVRKMAELWIRDDSEIEQALVNVGGTARFEQWLKLKTASNCGESIIATLDAGTERLA